MSMSLAARQGRGNPFAAYNIGGQTPQTIADFEADKYRADGTTSTAASLLTHTRSGNAVQVADDGTLQWAGHNLLTYSEDFSNASWSKAFTAVTENAETAPDGTSSADLIQHTQGGPFPTVAASSSTFSVGSIITQSFFVKANVDGFLRVIVFDGSANGYGGWFNTATGEWATTSAIGTGTLSGSGVESFGDYYRISISGIAPAVTSARVIFYLTDSDNTTTRSTTPEVFIWGAHLYRSDLGGMADIPTSYRGLSSSSTYLPTTTAARYLPRVDNHIWDGSSWVKRCLVEPQSTNLLTYSSEFDNAAWAKSATVTANTSTAPDGTTTAETATSASPSNSVQQTLALAPGSPHRLSIYMKAGTSTRSNLALFDNTGGNFEGQLYIDWTAGVPSQNAALGSATGATFTSVGDGWYRISVTVTTDATNTSHRVFIYPDIVVGTGSILIWGAQLEASSVPTSYIPTAGATVTRPADALSIDSTLLPYDSTAMTIAMDGEVTHQNATSNTDFFVWEADADNRITTLLDNTLPQFGNVTLIQEASNTADVVRSGDDAYAPGINVPFNIASRHTSSDLNGAVDGTALTANTTVTALPDLSATDFQIAPTGVVNIKSLRILGGYGATDAELEAATS